MLDSELVDYAHMLRDAVPGAVSVVADISTGNLVVIHRKKRVGFYVTGAYLASTRKKRARKEILWAIEDLVAGRTSPLVKFHAWQ